MVVRLTREPPLRYAPTVADTHHAATYRRSLDVSAERIWENALDWEHLPHLHASTFASLELIEQTAEPERWRARVSLKGPLAQDVVIELRTDRPRLAYVTRTISGIGRDSEIRTRLVPRHPRHTDIVVEFHLAVPRLLAPIAGVAYKRLYDRLWSEDLAMMQHRQVVLDAAVARRDARDRAVDRRPVSQALGSVAQLRRRVPLVVTTPTGPLRIVALGADLVAHPTVCPHLGGPLDNAPVVDGCITCPWHGYRFDVRTGKPVGSHRCKLPASPEVVVDPVTREARLEWASATT